MANNEKVTIKIETQADLKGINVAQKGIKDLALEVKNTERQTNSFKEAVKKSFTDPLAAVQYLKMAIVGFLGILKQGIQFANETIQAHLESARAVKTLEASYQALGITGTQAIKNAQAFASEMQAATGIADETFLNAQKLMAQYGIVGQKAQEAIKAAYALSQGVGMSFESAMMQLAKASVGATESLSRYGIVLGDGVKEGEKFGAAKINQLTGIKPADIARIATDPGYAALMRLKAQAARGEIPFIEIGGRGGAAFGSITGPLTSKEKDLYRKQVRKNLMNNARGKTFYSKNGEGIKFNRAGIDKGMSTTSKTDKLLMLDNAPKISSGAVPLPFEYIKDPYIKTMAAPVSADGRKDIALITLEAQKNKPAFFHNINPISYWAGKYGGFKKGIPSKSSWYQGKGQKNAPRFAHPAYKSGAMPKGDNNIANNNKKVNALRKSQKAYKMGDVFKDGSILALRPFSLGYNMRAGKKEKPYRRGDVFKVFENR